QATRPDPQPDPRREACKQEKRVAKDKLKFLFKVRNKLPTTHGKNGLDLPTLNRLIRESTQDKFASVPDLLFGMVAEARQVWGRGRGRPHLPSLVDDVRKELTRRREAEPSPRRHR